MKGTNESNNASKTVTTSPRDIINWFNKDLLARPMLKLYHDAETIEKALDCIIERFQIKKMSPEKRDKFEKELIFLRGKLETLKKKEKELDATGKNHVKRSFNYVRIDKLSCRLSWKTIRKRAAKTTPKPR